MRKIYLCIVSVILAVTLCACGATVQNEAQPFSLGTIQGQTYESANIAPHCFASGQLYVALSRIKSIENLHLTSKIKAENLISSEDVLNFYENEALKNAENNDSVTKSTHGGHRTGAGRKKKYGTATCTIRIPISAKEAVLEFINSQNWD